MFGFIKKNIVAIILSIIALILVISYFKPNKPVKDIYFDKYMALKDSMVNHALEDAKGFKEMYFAKAKEDSATMANLIQSQKNFTIKFNDNLSKIPINIASIAGNDDSIRAAFANY